MCWLFFLVIPIILCSYYSRHNIQRRTFVYLYIFRGKADSVRKDELTVLPKTPGTKMIWSCSMALLCQHTPDTRSPRIKSYVGTSSPMSVGSSLVSQPGESVLSNDEWTRLTLSLSSMNNSPSKSIGEHACWSGGFWPLKPFRKKF